MKLKVSIDALFKISISVTITLNLSLSLFNTIQSTSDDDNIYYIAVLVNEDDSLVTAKIDTLETDEWINFHGIPILPNLPVWREGLIMPNVKKLSPENKKKLLGCVKGKNKSWSKKHGGKRVPQRINQEHFKQCSRDLGFD